MNMYEIWGMVGIKAIPPSAVLLRHLQQNNQPFIPQEPVLIIEVYCLPSTRRDFLDKDEP